MGPLTKHATVDGTDNIYVQYWLAPLVLGIRRNNLRLLKTILEMFVVFFRVDYHLIIWSS